MKYHMVGSDGKTSLCKKVAKRPDTWVMDLCGFTTHYAKDMKCKMCTDILERKAERGGK